jgi:hypothetical protein
MPLALAHMPAYCQHTHTAKARSTKRSARTSPPPPLHTHTNRSPDKWKEGSSNTVESGGRKLNANKLLDKSKKCVRCRVAVLLCVCGCLRVRVCACAQPCRGRHAVHVLAAATSSCTPRPFTHHTHHAHTAHTPHTPHTPHTSQVLAVRRQGRQVPHLQVHAAPRGALLPLLRLQQGPVRDVRRAGAWCVRRVVHLPRQGTRTRRCERECRHRALHVWALLHAVGLPQTHTHTHTHTRTHSHTQILDTKSYKQTKA